MEDNNKKYDDLLDIVLGAILGTLLFIITY